MRPIGRWAHMASSSVLVEAKTGQDGYDKPTYGPPAQYVIHFARSRQDVRTAGGNVLGSDQHIYVMSGDLIMTTARVTLTTQDAGSTEDSLLHPPILAVTRRYDDNGPHHSVLILGKGGKV